MAEKKQWHETLRGQFRQYFAVDDVLYHERTDHQDLIIFENAAFGRVMALDSVVQTTGRDEFIYHEMTTYVPLLAHGHTKHVLVTGGGDGAMLREVTRHRNVESITMVEIGVGVMSFCRQYLSNHNVGSYDGPCFKLVINDGVNFVNRTNQTFDAIIPNCAGPIGPGENLSTSAFYKGYERCLNPGDIFITQNDICFLQQEEAINSHRKFSHHFGDVDFYQAAIPTYYGGVMAFAQVTDNGILCHLSTETIQVRFLASGLEYRYHNPAVHTAASVSPQYLQDALAPRPSQGEDKKLKELKLHSFDNLTKSLSFCIYNICYAKTAKERGGYIAYIDELYNANRLTEILSETCSIIGANILNIAHQDYESQGASVTILVSEGPVDPKLIDKTEHPDPLPETVAARLDKSHICVHTCPEDHPGGDLYIFRANTEVSTCDVISPLKALSYLIHRFESDIVIIDCRVRGFTCDINSMKHFTDHEINSTQNFMPEDMRALYDMVDVNVYQENIFHTKVLLKEFDFKHYMFHTESEDLADSERQEITAALWKKMREIYYRRNMPTV